MRFGHSGCKMCPFRSDEEWLEMKTSHPGDFEEACLYDEAIRHGLPGIKGEGYLHDSLVPLREIDFEKLVRDRSGQLFARDCGGSECRT